MSEAAGSALFFWVEPIGLEPTTSCLQSRESGPGDLPKRDETVAPLGDRVLDASRHFTSFPNVSLTIRGLLALPCSPAHPFFLRPPPLLEPSRGRGLGQGRAQLVPKGCEAALTGMPEAYDRPGGG
jgi:hypothetical protein